MSYASTCVNKNVRYITYQTYEVLIVYASNLAGVKVLTRLLNAADAVAFATLLTMRVGG